ncbi:MAG: glycosyltransferase [Leptolyngbyaceae bacterium]|nr:glycosyltransferase [Leptolyngbyaceae bacterium]
MTKDATMNQEPAQTSRENIANIPKQVMPTLTATAPQNIPRLIHQTFETCSVPARMQEAAMTWSNLNPEYEYRFSDKDDRVQFIQTHFEAEVLAAYHALNNGAFKADLWRYCKLYVEGGVYADVDTLCSRPLSKLIRPDDAFIVPSGVGPYYVFNAFICSVPHHPFLHKAIYRAVELILAQEHKNMTWVTGPIGLGVSINLELGREEEHPIEVGDHQVGDSHFRILQKIHTEDASQRRVVDGDEVVLYAKYDGYFTDLESTSVTHWKKAKGKSAAANGPNGVLGKIKRSLKKLLKRG